MVSLESPDRGQSSTNHLLTGTTFPEQQLSWHRNDSISPAWIWVGPGLSQVWTPAQCQPLRHGSCSAPSETAVPTRSHWWRPVEVPTTQSSSRASRAGEWEAGDALFCAEMFQFAVVTSHTERF